MTLLEFFKLPDAPSQRAFARSVDVTHSAMNHYIHLRRSPSGPVACRIIEESSGMITYGDLYGHPNLEDTPTTVGERANG